MVLNHAEWPNKSNVYVFKLQIDVFELKIKVCNNLRDMVYHIKL